MDEDFESFEQKHSAARASSQPKRLRKSPIVANAGTVKSANSRVLSVRGIRGHMSLQKNQQRSHDMAMAAREAEGTGAPTSKKAADFARSANLLDKSRRKQLPLKQLQQHQQQQQLQQQQSSKIQSPGAGIGVHSSDWLRAHKRLQQQLQWKQSQPQQIRPGMLSSRRVEKTPASLKECFASSDDDDISVGEQDRLLQPSEYLSPPPPQQQQSKRRPFSTPRQQQQVNLCTSDHEASGQAEGRSIRKNGYQSSFSSAASANSRVATVAGAKASTASQSRRRALTDPPRTNQWDLHLSSQNQSDDGDDQSDFVPSKKRARSTAADDVSMVDAPTRPKTAAAARRRLPSTESSPEPPPRTDRPRRSSATYYRKQTPPPTRPGHHEHEPIDLETPTQDSCDDATPRVHLSRPQDDIHTKARFVYPFELSNAAEGKSVSLVRGQVAVTDADLRTLEPHEFLNDSIIEFRLRWLAHQYDDFPPGDHRKQYHVFSSFFYRALLSGGYAKVQKWTKNTDIFAKKAVFVPINEAAHWRLVVLINLHSNRPCLISMDSMKVSNNTQTKRVLEEYLCAEWAAKKPAELERKFRLDFHVAEVPQQTNGSDCGVFMLYYVEKMMITERFEDSIIDEMPTIDAIKAFDWEFWFAASEVTRDRIKKCCAQVEQEYIKYKARTARSNDAVESARRSFEHDEEKNGTPAVAAGDPNHLRYGDRSQVAAMPASEPDARVSAAHILSTSVGDAKPFPNPSAKLVTSHTFWDADPTLIRHSDRPFRRLSQQKLDDGLSVAVAEDLSSDSGRDSSNNAEENSGEAGAPTPHAISPPNAETDDDPVHADELTHIHISPSQAVVISDDRTVAKHGILREGSVHTTGGVVARRKAQRTFSERNLRSTQGRQLSQQHEPDPLDSSSSSDSDRSHDSGLLSAVGQVD